MNFTDIQNLDKDFDENTKIRICVEFAVACAEKCLPVFTQHIIGDSRPKLAIEAAKEWLQNPTQITKDASLKADKNAYECAEKYKFSRSSYAASVTSAAASSVEFYTNSIVASRESYYAISDVLDNGSGMYNEEILWQRYRLIEIISSYKKSQIFALINPKDNTIVGNLQPDILRAVYKFL